MTHRIFLQSWPLSKRVLVCSEANWKSKQNCLPFTEMVENLPGGSIYPKVIDT